MNTPSNFTNLDLIDVEERRLLLNAYIDGELSTEESLHVSGWLDDNAGALREVEHLRHIGDLLESYEDEPIPADFAANVFSGVGIGQQRRSGKMLSMAWYRRPLASAAAVMLAVGATVFVMQNADEDGGLAPTTTIATTDVVSVLKDVPADELGDLLLHADVLLSVDDAALEESSFDEEFDAENGAGG